MSDSKSPVALITGSASRVGAVIATQLHAHGYRVAIHYNHSHQDAKRLVDKLNSIRKNSSACFQAEFFNHAASKSLITQVLGTFSQLDVLVNNASCFFATPLEDCDESAWDQHFDTHAKAVFFLCLDARESLRQTAGHIVNITDIHTQQALKHHSIYCAAKAAIAMLTRNLALELAPEIKVNSIAPGNVLWPEPPNELSIEKQQSILKKIPLGRVGNPSDIANAVCWIVQNTNYLTGQCLHVAGGRQDLS